MPLVKVSTLIEHMGHPFKQTLWGYAPISRKDIKQRIDLNQLDNRPYQSFTADAMLVLSRDYHIQRIAWLVINPDLTRIEIDVGNPLYQWHQPYIDDGWHRFLAATYLNQEMIGVCFTGSIDVFEQLFPEAIWL